MAMDRDVTIDFNADISGYTASMGQMIQQTSQYTAAADGMIGKIGKLNNVVMSGVKSMSAFTQTNKVATAQAAAYQQQLSKIETSAKVTGKSFKDLEKTTKGLAKDFPIGMKQAVEQVESLQEAGVTTNKEINTLAKTFTKLGAATGTFGPEMGQNMLQLNRTFQNGTGNMEKYADSLTTVTHLYGANAGAVTNFAKSIAPVAATVGMSETSVIGLSTAFSRLGEDGYAAANTFNKVMLDMSKSIREGTPEAKIYAEVMGTTSENLKETWESNPAEGFIQFVEAIKKQGQGGIRSLEQLGLEGVRTQKTIMALANSGNMREIVGKAQSAYGSGSTAEAAETAMGGVNDQMTMLNETMAQTAATAGKPFLGFLEDVLGVANSLSKVIASIAESDLIQGLAKIVGVAGAAFGAVKLLNTVAVTGAMGQLLGRAVISSRPAAGFRAGWAGGLTGAAAEGRAASAGAIARLYLGGGGGEGGPGGIRAIPRTLRNWGNVGGNAAALYFRSNEAAMLRAMRENPESLSTEAGRRFQAGATQLGTAGASGQSWLQRRRIASAAAKEMTAAVNDMATQQGGISKAMSAYASQTRTSARYLTRAGAAGARGLGTLGSAATMGLATGPAALAVGAAAVVGGAGYMMYKGYKGEQEGEERGRTDAYRLFNDFAEKAGIATKGLVTFSQALAESTAKIASGSKTMEEAFTRTSQESLNAQNPAYERAWETRANSTLDKITNWGGINTEKEAFRIRGTLGANATPEAINRMQMDLTNELGGETADKIMKSVQDIYKNPETGKPMSSKEVEARLRQLETDSRGLFGKGTVESAEYAEMAQAEATRRQTTEQEVYGQAGAEAMHMRSGEEAFAAWQKTQAMPRGAGGLASPEAYEAGETAKEQMMAGLELSKDEQRKVRRAMSAALTPQQAAAAGVAAPTFESILRDAGLTEKADWYASETGAQGKAAGGFSGLSKEEFESKYMEGEMEKRAQAADDFAQSLGMTSGTVGTEMADLAKKVRHSGKTFDEWQESGQEGATALQKAYADVQALPGSDTAKEALAREALKTAQADTAKAGTGAVGVREALTTALTQSTGAQTPAIQQALAYAAQQEQQSNEGLGRWQIQGQKIEEGRRAEEALKSDKLTTEQRDVYTATAATGKAEQTARTQQIQSFMVQQRRVMEDYNRQVGRMNQQFELSQQYAAEDYAKQRKYMIQDYHRGVLRAEEDFHTQRMRAQRDFDKQVKRQAEQTAKNMFDPYQRIAPQMVTDIGVLQQSLLEQNQSVQEQLGSVDMLSKMGLSKDAIDQLKLMDPTQNAQVQRLLSDAMSDPTAINKINDLIRTRLKLGTEISTSEYNKDFQNMKDDFGQSMDDMSDDFNKNMKRGEQDFRRGLRRNGEAFATAQSRAAEAHNLALTHMAEDNERAITRSTEDLTGMAEEFTTSYVDIETKFLQDLANLPSNLSTATKAAITKVLQDEIDAIEAAHTKGAAAGAAAGASAGAGGGGEGGEDMEGVDGPTAGVGSYSGNWRYYRNSRKWHGGADISAPHGTPTYSVIDGKVKYTKRLTTSYGIHALISDGKHDFLYGHMSALHVNAGDTVHPGTQIGKVGSTGNSTGNHLHFEARRAGMGNGEAGNVNPGPWLADGGIATRYTRANIGEGGPEAVIPLNDKGVRYLADAMSKASMGRYWQPMAAHQSRASTHSSPVTNNIYSYDQRTQFTGPVEVKSQDPEDMARKLAQRERRNRLARKTGSAA